MEKTAVLKRTRTVEFWDGYAKWYKLWIEHSYYHDRIIETLMNNVKPDWKILDIGAGNGILSFPLCAIGCDVRAVEPSKGMRSLLYEEASKRGIDWIKVDERKWEEIGYNYFRGYDLLIACHSLHSTQMGFEDALLKMFKLQPTHVLVVTETNLPEIKIKWQYGDYQMLFANNYLIENPFAYHSIDEVFEHWEFERGRRLSSAEKQEISSKLSFRDGHMWIDDKTDTGMYWWSRTNI